MYIRFDFVIGKLVNFIGRCVFVLKSWEGKNKRL